MAQGWSPTILPWARAVPTEPSMWLPSRLWSGSALPGGDSSGQCPLGGCLAPRAVGGLQHPAGCPANPRSPQASQLGVYKAFVDNYKIALETAEKCSQSNYQFQKISEVSWSGAVPRGWSCHGWACPGAGRRMPSPWPS